MKKKEETKGAARTSRRGFAKGAAAALAAAPLVAAARAQTPSTKPSGPKAPPNPQPATPTPQGQAPQPSPAVVDAYLAVARARFGERLSEEELAHVRRDLEGNVRTSERLATTKLNNWDEPDYIFEA